MLIIVININMVSWSSMALSGGYLSFLTLYSTILLFVKSTQRYLSFFNINSYDFWLNLQKDYRTWTWANCYHKCHKIHTWCYKFQIVYIFILQAFILERFQWWFCKVSFPTEHIIKIQNKVLSMQRFWLHTSNFLNSVTILIQ